MFKKGNPKKEGIIKGIHELLELNSNFAFMSVESLSVAQNTELRSIAKKQQVHVKFISNKITRVAFEMLKINCNDIVLEMKNTNMLVLCSDIFKTMNFIKHLPKNIASKINIKFANENGKNLIDKNLIEKAIMYENKPIALASSVLSLKSVLVRFVKIFELYGEKNK